MSNLFDEIVSWVGPANIVHLVTDNAANYVAAGRIETPTIVKKIIGAKPKEKGK